MLKKSFILISSLCLIIALFENVSGKELDATIGEGIILNVYDTHKMKIKFTKGVCKGIKTVFIKNSQSNTLFQNKKIRFMINSDCSNILTVLGEEENER